MLTHKCKKCHHQKVFTSKRGLKNASQRDECVFCKGINLENIEGGFYVKRCPQCKSIQRYQSKQRFWEATKNDTRCYSCSNTINTKLVVNHPGPVGKHWTLGEDVIAARRQKYCDGYVISTKGKSRSSETKAKCKKSLEKYKGDGHWVHRPGGLDRCLSGRYKRKAFVFPSGRKVFVQGYENLSLQFLMKNGIHENDIETETKDKPRIKYEFKGKLRWYYPDIYIKNNNEIIETKSSYTYEADKEKNDAKILASVTNGYNVRLMIYDNKGKYLQKMEYFPKVGDM